MSEERQETVADIVAAMRDESHAGDASFLEWVGSKMRSYADRIEAAEKREDSMWRAAFAKIEAVVTLQHAKRNLGEQARRAIAEIMSACRFPDGALDEYERTFEENARLRAALKPVLDIVMDMRTSDLSMRMAIKEAKRIYWSSSAKEKGGD